MIIMDNIAKYISHPLVNSLDLIKHHKIYQSIKKYHYFILFNVLIRAVAHLNIKV